MALGCSADLGGPAAGENGAATGDDALQSPEVDLEAAAEDPTICVPGVPGTSQIPRLTQSQYDNTVRDLLGVDSQASSMLAPDTTGSVDQRAWDGYQLAAESLAAEVAADSSLLNQLLPCTLQEGGADCARQFIEEFGLRAFRRPLTEEEAGRFESLFTNRAELTPDGTFEEAIELLVQGFLVSPSFLMKAEISEVPEGEHFALNGYEIASRLSYMLWESMPDDQLLSAAAAGELSTPAQILEQARRMLADPKARQMVSAFHEHYLHMGPGTRWADISRDPDAFPNFDESMAPLLSRETTRFMDYVVFDRGGTFQDLFTSPIGFVNAALAPMYGLDPASFGDDLEPVELDATRRAGVLTRLGFLTSHSLFDRSSPILRGAFVQKEILCTPIGTPPPEAEGTPLPTDGLETNRERVDAQTSAAGCANCHHTFINPTGFTLETYDAVGAYQQTEAFSGAPIDAAASVIIDDEPVEVDGPVELSQTIADAPQAHTCYARKWVQFAYDRELTNQDSCTVDNLSAKLTEGGYTVLDLVADLTQSEYFSYRAVETEEAQ